MQNGHDAYCVPTKELGNRNILRYKQYVALNLIQRKN
jgi:hypothetical protein